MLIGVDLDEILADFNLALRTFHNDTYGTSLTREHFISYRFAEVWGGTDEETLKKIADFRKSPHYKDMLPVVGSIEGVKALKQNNKLIVITSRRSTNVEKIGMWIERYFSSMFEDIYFAYNPFTGNNQKTKAEICLDLKTDYLIDDLLEYTRECAEKGIKSVLLDCPWNQCKELHENITRVKNWEEIVSIINNKA